ncbi:MAG: zinc ribbon domain-containing protein [Bacillota bacterium]
MRIDDSCFQVLTYSSPRLFISLTRSNYLYIVNTLSFLTRRLPLQCPHCRTQHQRDANASINILQQG